MFFTRKRLIEAFHAGGWALYSRNIFYDKNINLVCYHGVLFVLGQFISEAVGEQKYHPNNKSMTYASAVEGAKTDCLTRCCKDLGIATELWSPNFIMEWKQDFAISEWYTDKRDNNKVLLWRRKDYPQYGWPYEISNNNTHGESDNNNQLDQKLKTEPSFEDKCKNAKEWLFKQTGTHTIYLKMLEDMGVTTAQKIDKKKQNFFLQKIKRENATGSHKRKRRVIMENDFFDSILNGVPDVIEVETLPELAEIDDVMIISTYKDIKLKVVDITVDDATIFEVDRLYRENIKIYKVP